MASTRRPARFSGAVALVTGGGAGIGAAVCRQIAAEGAVAIAADLSGERVDALAASTTGVHGAQLDVTDSAAVDHLVEHIVAEHGRLDVVVNAAGTDTREDMDAIAPRIDAQLREAATGRIVTALDATVEMTDEQWRRALSSHLDGTFYCIRAALRPMRVQRSGAIVNVASMWGIAGATGQPHYSAAKGGVLALTRSVAKEVIVQGIRVNAVAPGWVETDRLAGLSAEARRQKAAQAPIGRFATAEEIAPVVLFLASDEASYFVGATLSANGGVITV